MHEQLDDQLDYQSYFKLRKQMGVQLNNQLYIQLRTRFVEQLYDQLYNQLDDQLLDQLNTRLSDCVSSNSEIEYISLNTDAVELYHDQMLNLDDQLDNQFRDYVSPGVRNQLYTREFSTLAIKLDVELSGGLSDYLCSEDGD